MADADFTQPEKSIEGPACSESVMLELWYRTQDSLNEKELEWFAGASDHAFNMAKALNGLTEGIGCSIGGNASGYFNEDHNLPQLMFAIANTAETLAGLIRISSEASFLLRRVNDKKGVHHE
ncbi:hypothetical protein ACMYR3_10100 [Ampullimonas aquatilis]|uniref:hypothetical protein n=1 Tax=Ampullimonas aquatilis TaxID=1341549 RepID=UPI003C721230